MGKLHWIQKGRSEKGLGREPEEREEEMGSPKMLLQPTESREMQFVGVGRQTKPTPHPTCPPAFYLSDGLGTQPWRHDSREAGPRGLLQDVRQLLLVVQEVLLNVPPGLKGLGFALFLLHKILPDVLEVLGLHDAQPAASLL